MKAGPMGILRGLLHALPVQFGRRVRDPAADAVSELERAAQQRLGRSLALWHLGTGGCGACELELAALGGVAYDLERLGLRFAASPRHADVLLVTGPVTRTMRSAALRTWEAMPAPKWVVAVGGCAADGGPFRGSYAVLGGLDGVLPIHLAIPGCPPDPAAVLAGLRVLLDANARPASP